MSASDSVTALERDARARCEAIVDGAGLDLPDLARTALIELCEAAWFDGTHYGLAGCNVEALGSVEDLTRTEALDA